ncbi:MAG: tRNA glutamyl-Q(34) synthetase GluQRS [Solimonas sp.]
MPPAPIFMTARSDVGSYRGRFAPTPSGLLHEGSMLTALASYLDARAHGGRWLLRIDDLDAPRCMRGAADGILRQLEAHGLFWDEAPRYQSAHGNAYREALQQLKTAGRLYTCRCTRAELAHTSRTGPDGPVYAGTCRERHLHLVEAGMDAGQEAMRYASEDIDLAYVDRIQGALQRHLRQDVGDFPVLRRDGIIGYHLACAVDEDAQGITHVVRGADLIGSTFAQLALLRTLGLRIPRYAHVPVLCGADGIKLSKQNHAHPVDSARPADTLRRCLRHLGQDAPDELGAAGEMLPWAIGRWRISAIPAGPVLTPAG